jgi:predicted aspartyl protease
MSAYHIDLTVTNPKREEIRSEPIRVLVDTGSEFTWLPAEELSKVGVYARHQRVFRMADGRTIVRDVGFCILEAEGFITNDAVVFAEPGDLHLLGVHTLEGFGVSVDPVNHRLIPTIAIVATTTPSARPQTRVAS